MISFDVTKEEHAIIIKIARAAVALALEHEVDYTIADATMDLTACHANGMPLQLDVLLAAKDTHPADFGHDVFGIRRFICRDTGKMLNCFVPRFAQH